MENVEKSVVVFETKDEHGNGEIQVGTDSDLHPGEMRLMLQVAIAKLELLEFRLMLRAAQRQQQPQIIRASNIGGLHI